MVGVVVLIIIQAAMLEQALMTCPALMMGQFPPSHQVPPSHRLPPPHQVPPPQQVLKRCQVVVMSLVRLTGPIAVTDRDTILRDMRIQLISGLGIPGHPIPLGLDKAGRAMTKQRGE